MLLEEVALDESEIHQLCVSHRSEGIDAVLGGQWQGWVEQRIGFVVALADDGKDDAVPAFYKVVDFVAFMTEYRISDIDPALMDFFCMTTKCL